MANNAQVSLASEIEPNQFSCMDELFGGFSSLTFPESNQKKVVSGAAPNLAPNPEGFIPLAVYGSTSITRPAPPMSTPTPTPTPTTTTLSGCGAAGVCFFRPKLTNQYLFVNPALPQESSTRMVQWHQNQLFPFGLVGASRGTGVFHPQPRLPHINRTIKNKREINNTKQEVKVSPQRNSSKVDRGLEKKQEECRQHLLSEMGLPKEWTY